MLIDLKKKKTILLLSPPPSSSHFSPSSPSPLVRGPHCVLRVRRQQGRELGRAAGAAPRGVERPEVGGDFGLLAEQLPSRRPLSGVVDHGGGDCVAVLVVGDRRRSRGGAREAFVLSAREAAFVVLSAPIGSAAAAAAASAAPAIVSPPRLPRWLFPGFSAGPGAALGLDLCSRHRGGRARGRRGRGGAGEDGGGRGSSSADR